MKAVTPVISGLEQFETVFGKNQPEYAPLPALIGGEPETNVLARFELTPDERQAIADGADIYIGQWTFGHKYAPVNAFVGKPDAFDVNAVAKEMRLGEVLTAETVNNALDKLRG